MAGSPRRNSGAVAAPDGRNAGGRRAGGYAARGATGAKRRADEATRSKCTPNMTRETVSQALCRSLRRSSMKLNHSIPFLAWTLSRHAYLPRVVLHSFDLTKGRADFVHIPMNNLFVKILLSNIRCQHRSAAQFYNFVLKKCLPEKCMFTPPSPRKEAKVHF